VTSKTSFTESEWEQVLSGPPMAGMIVATADHGGMMRETFAMTKAYGEARKQHGKSELLDEIVSAKPERDHTRFHSYDELKRHATADEVDDYRRFVLTLARRTGRPRGCARRRRRPWMIL
jgi:hypothetical protein